MTPANSVRFLGAVLLAAAVSSSATAAETPPPPGFPSPEERQRMDKIAAADRARLMALLGLTEPADLPPEDADPKRPAGARRREGDSRNWTDDEGHFIVRSSWGNWINYDEAKAEVGPLPDPLVARDGTPVTSAEEWWTKRRSEILRDFVTEIYGRIPDDTPEVTWEIVESDTRALGGRARLKRLVGHIDNSRHPAATPSIQLTLHTPANATGPVPVIVAIGGFSFPPGFVFPGAPEGPSALELLLARGWGHASYDARTVQADHGAGLTGGIIGLMNQGRPRPPDQWGSIAAWSWGLSRVIDYFETNPDVDARRLGVQGHSRYGKTALVAAAFDSRWAIVYASCSGAAGAKLHRHDFGENLDIVASSGEYHWMAGNFLKYGGRWGDLPVDQHELIALVAPRPIFVTGGTQDLWPDPAGMFKACVAAGPVYRLLGRRDLGRIEMPPPDEALIAGDIGFRLHTGGHFDLFDWPAFLEFAATHFGTPAP